MNGSVTVGRIRGVPLRIHWTAPLLVIVIGVGLGSSTLPAWAPGHSSTVYRIAALVGALLLAASLVLHEAAHALLARRAGIEVKDVTVFALGGVTRMGQATTPRTQGWVAAVGPLTSLLLGGLGFAGAVLTHDAFHWAVPAAVLAWTGWANVLLGVFNLLPAAPLDGGRVLQAIVWRLRGDRERAIRVAGRCGQVAGALMVLGGWVEFAKGGAGGLWLTVLGLFVSMAAYAEVRRSVLYDALRGVRVGEAMPTPVVTGQDWLTVDRFLAETVPRTGRRVIPLTDFDGRPSGVVTVPGLLTVPTARRSEVRVRDLAVPLGRCTLAAPDDRVTDVLDRGGLTPTGHVLVLDEGRVAGILTPEDITRVAQHHHRPPATPNFRKVG